MDKNKFGEPVDAAMETDRRDNLDDFGYHLLSRPAFFTSQYLADNYFFCLDRRMYVPSLLCNSVMEKIGHFTPRPITTFLFSSCGTQGLIRFDQKLKCPCFVH